MKKLITLSMVLLLLAGLVGCGSNQPAATKDKGSGKALQVGIIQIVEHPALDAAREGFLEALKKTVMRKARIWLSTTKMLRATRIIYSLSLKNWLRKNLI